MVVEFAGPPVLAVVPEQTGHPRHGLVVRGKGAAIAETPEDLERVEAEAPGEPERPSPPTSVGRAQRLRGVLDDG